MRRVQGKVWGETEPLFAVNGVSGALIRAHAGGVCSKHRHVAKFNAFYCLRGRLLVRVWKREYDLVDTTTLAPGDMCVCRPGEFHQFEALSDCEALEVYWAECRDEDIERESVGFAKTAETAGRRNADA